MSKKKTVIFVCTQMEAGGVQIRAKNMQEYLTAQGYSAKIVFLYSKRKVFELSDDIISLHDGPVRSLWAFLGILKGLYQIFRKQRPHAVIGFAHYSSPIATTLAWFSGVPVRIGTQTSPPYTHNFLARALDAIAGTLGIYTHNIATSKMIADCFRRWPHLYRRRLSVIYNGVKQRVSDMNQSKARDVFGLPESVFTFINCGRLSSEKNQKFLLKIIDRIPNSHLAILGEGEMRAELEQEIAARHLGDRVSLLGEIPPERVPDFLRCGDVFLFPSKYEAFGLAVVEAMAAGLPVISSDHPALVEVVAEGGRLLPLEVDLWVREAQKMREASPQQIEALSRNAQARAKLFTHTQMIERFKEIFG